MGANKCGAARGFTDKPTASTLKHTCNQAATNIMATERKHGRHNPSITISKPCTKLDTVWAHKVQETLTALSMDGEICAFTITLNETELTPDARHHNMYIDDSLIFDLI